MLYVKLFPIFWFQFLFNHFGVLLSNRCAEESATSLLHSHFYILGNMLTKISFHNNSKLVIIGIKIDHIALLKWIIQLVISPIKQSKRFANAELWRNSDQHLVVLVVRSNIKTKYTNTFRNHNAKRSKNCLDPQN